MSTFAGKRQHLPSIMILVCTLVMLGSACGPAPATSTPTWVYSTPTPGKTLCVDMDVHSNCYSSVSDALKHAGHGDIIEVHSGDYTDNIDIHVNISLRGVFPDGPAATTIRGAASSDKPVITVEGGYTVFIQNLHITGGNTAGGLESHGFVHLYNMHIDHNSTSSFGGGINAGGGGPYHTYGSLDIRSSSITDNSANNTDSIYTQGGGGINAIRTDLTLTDTQVSSNSAKSGGGGLFVIGRTLVIKNSTISGNNTGGSGGGMYAAANLQMTDSTVSQNTASADGGGIYFTPNTHTYPAGTPVTTFFVDTIERATIDHNRADGNGGGLENFGEDLTLTNLTVSGNTAVGRGAGIYNSSYKDISNPKGPTAGAIMHIYSTTIANNISNPAGGGGIADDVNPAAPNQLIISTSILSNNFGGNCRLGAGFQSWDYNLSSDSTCILPYHADKINTAAKLNPLAGTGALKTHALQPGSPAVDLVEVCSGTDERGVPRGTPLCDAGSYEGTAQPFHFSSQQMNAIAVVKADCLAGPGTGYETLGYLEAGNPHSIIGRNSDGTWLKLDTCWAPTGKLWTDDDPQTAPVLEVPPLATALPTSGPLTCTPNINAFCRLGPGVVFDPLEDLAMSGQAYPMDGQNLGGTWYRIMLEPNEGCWVPADVCLPSGDTSGLRVLNEVPTPTSVPSSAPSCSTYTDKTTCSAHGSLCQWKFTTSGPGKCVNK